MTTCENIFSSNYFIKGNWNWSRSTADIVGNCHDIGLSFSFMSRPIELTIELWNKSLLLFAQAQLKLFSTSQINNAKLSDTFLNVSTLNCQGSLLKKFGNEICFLFFDISAIIFGNSFQRTNLTVFFEKSFEFTWKS